MYLAVTGSLMTAIKAVAAPPVFVDAPWHASRLEALIRMMDVHVSSIVFDLCVEQAAPAGACSDPALDAWAAGVPMLKDSCR